MNYNKETLARSLHTKWAGQAIRFYEKIDSTNLEAGRVAGEALHGTLLVAKRQTAGRGRRGRIWESEAVENIYFSLLLKPEMSVEKTSMLTLVMAMAVLKGLEACAFHEKISEQDLDVAELRVATSESCMPEREMCTKQDEWTMGIKWPNDIVLNSKKLCGILTEAKLTGTALEHVIIGVGINVGKQDFSEELVDKATSLAQECGYMPDRNALIAGIMNAFEVYYEQFVQTGSLAELKSIYNARLLNRDRQVRVLDPQGEFDGIARGINDIGELLVECDDGTLTAVYAGEVSVRGIYGYV